MIIVGIVCIAVVLGAVNFLSTRKAAQERFAVYEEKSQTIETTYGTLSYIDEGEGEVILSCHGICGGYDQAYDTLAGKIVIVFWHLPDLGIREVICLRNLQLKSR